MDRVLYVPSVGSWSFGPVSSFPFNFSFPVGNPGGNVYLTGSTPGSTPPNGEGVRFTVSIDGGGPGLGACLENGGYGVVIPPGATSLSITKATGCNGGPNPTTGTVTGAGP